MNQRKLYTLLTLLILSVFTGARAQDSDDADSYKFDIGLGLGMSGYLGDVNESNMFRRPGFTGQLSFRYMLEDARWAFRGVFTTSQLKGNSGDFKNWLPGETPYSFSSTIYDLGGRVEFNFFPYGIGETFKKLKRWTPYVGVGVGVCLASADGTYVTASVPLAVGVKYKPRKRLNLMLEFCVSKTLGDHLDGQLSDLQGIKSSFLKNTDWHSGLLLSLSYEFGRRCSTCHYVD
ncbi:MAG: outer membrane beta-barrel protein [Bacteroides sp.]|nr:outer membrane beta-barrel protein [Bacteroides sp.]